MVQRNKGLNFSIRYKGGGNFAVIRNPVTREENLIEEDAGLPGLLLEATGDNILLESGGSIPTEDT